MVTTALSRRVAAAGPHGAHGVAYPRGAMHPSPSMQTFFLSTPVAQVVSRHVVPIYGQIIGLRVRWFLCSGMAVGTIAIFHCICIDSLFALYSILALVRTQGTVEICSPYPEYVLTGVLGIKKYLKGTKIVFVLFALYLLYYLATQDVIQ